MPSTSAARLPARRSDLAYYTSSELVAILHRAAGRLGVGIDRDAALVLATASRDTPFLVRRGLIVRTRRGRALA